MNSFRAVFTHALKFRLQQLEQDERYKGQVDIEMKKKLAKKNEEHEPPSPHYSPRHNIPLSPTTMIPFEMKFHPSRK
jgi:hypothetical protein